MPWPERSVVSERKDFVLKALAREIPARAPLHPRADPLRRAPASSATPPGAATWPPPSTSDGCNSRSSPAASSASSNWCATGSPTGRRRSSPRGEAEAPPDTSRAGRRPVDCKRRHPTSSGQERMRSQPRRLNRRRWRRRRAVTMGRARSAETGWRPGMTRGLRVRSGRL
jgi:hypothetical protein